MQEPDWTFEDYLDALAENEEWNANEADIARAKGTVAGTHCAACGDALGDQLGPNCSSCDRYLDEEEFN